MKEVVLVHWKEQEVSERIARLKKAGFKARWFEAAIPENMRTVRKDPPLAMVIDLGRMPSHGRAVGIAMRQRKSTRAVPLVFVEGDPEKVAKIREFLPDAEYTTWGKVGPVLKRALKTPLVAPFVPPDVMPFSDTPLVKKLGIKAGCRVLVLGAPDAFARKLNPLPEGVEVEWEGRGPAHRVMLFVKSLRELEAGFSPAERAMEERGGLWIVYPKKTSRLASDLTQQDIREYGLARGVVDYKICAVDETWTGLLFSRRRK